MINRVPVYLAAEGGPFSKPGIRPGHAGRWKWRMRATTQMAKQPRKTAKTIIMEPPAR